MTATDNRSLIFESVTAIRIDIHPAGEEPDQHAVRATPKVSCTTTVCEVPNKLKLGPYSRNEVLAPTMARSSGHHGLPHSPSNKPPWSREICFNKVVTELVGLPGPVKPDMRPVKIKTCHQGQNDTVLNWHRRELPPWNLRIATTLSPPFPFEWSTFP
jgi:hypothetical protein